jgi:AraC-like DNA-binding protein
MGETSAGALQVAEFSTASFRPHERVAAWREAFGRTVLRIDISPQVTERFHASAKLVRAANFGLIEASTSAVRQGNSRALIANDDVSFGSVMTSQWSASQLGRTADLQPGDGVLMTNSDVGGMNFPKECRYFCFGVPRAAIAALVPDVGALVARRIPASSPAFRMLVRYLQLVRRDNVVTTPELAAAFTDHVCDLLALALGPGSDATEIARTRGLPAARLLAMKDDIRKNLGRPDLGVHWLAARHHVSVRYVQRLFEESGCTYTQFVLGERLAAAYQRLGARSDQPIHAVVYDLGFNDVSYFNRSFRQRFGCTPTDVRNGAVRS